MAKSNAPISGICKRKITAADLLIAWWFLPRMNLHPFKQHEATVNILLRYYLSFATILFHHIMSMRAHLKIQV